MPQLKLMLDTNAIVDFINHRDPYYEDARKLMVFGRVGEFSLSITASQITDLVYILSNGGKNASSALKTLRGLRTFIDVLPVDSTAIDMMLATTWNDPEDYLLYCAALNSKADALITRNASDFEDGLIPVLNCAELFDWVSREFDTTYDEVDF